MILLRVVHNHIVVLDAGSLVLLGNAAESVQEKTITELHDVCLVNTSDFLVFYSYKLKVN